MMRSFLLLMYLLLAFTCNSQSSQDNNPQDSSANSSIKKELGISKIRYYQSFSSGALIGCSSCNEEKQITYSASLVQGVTIYNRLRAGAGIGIDSYFGKQAIPLFGSISWDLIGNLNKNAVVIQLNYGWAKSWLDKSYREYGYTSITGGRMVNPQIGYRIKYGDLKISLMIGQKYQRITTHYEYPNYRYLFNGQIMPTEPNRKTVKESINRLAVSVAIGWR